MQETILIVEDELTLLETLAYNFRKEGYQVLTEDNGSNAVETALAEHPDLIILDIMLPGMDGLSVCRRVRAELAVPILMLTARTDEIDKVVGLEVGADDYVTKPFSMRELIARVKALLRRVRLTREEAEGDDGIPRGQRLVFDDLEIDMAAREVHLGDELLDLRPKEYDLLAFLARHRGVVLSRDLILERVWDWSYSGGSRTVDVHVRWLREKVEEDPSNPQRIITVRGAGYRFDG